MLASSVTKLIKIHIYGFLSKNYEAWDTSLTLYLIIYTFICAFIYTKLYYEHSPSKHGYCFFISLDHYCHIRVLLFWILFLSIALYSVFFSNQIYYYYKSPISYDITTFPAWNIKHLTIWICLQKENILLPYYVSIWPFDQE